jgi:hypothetical protein
VKFVWPSAVEHNAMSAMAAIAKNLEPMVDDDCDENE